MRHGFDTSNPGTKTVAGYEVAGGYVGGATPHVWSPAQWDAQPARFRCPFFVPYPGMAPAQQADLLLAALGHLGAPRGTIVFLDMETSADPGLVNGIANIVHAEGHPVGVYGSEGAVFGNPPRSGYFVALYDGVARLYEHPHSIAKQYTRGYVTPEGVTVDLSVFADSVPLWDTRPPVPVQLPSWAQQAVSALTGAIVGCEQTRQSIIANAK